MRRSSPQLLHPTRKDSFHISIILLNLQQLIDSTTPPRAGSPRGQVETFKMFHHGIDERATKLSRESCCRHGVHGFQHIYGLARLVADHCLVVSFVVKMRSIVAATLQQSIHLCQQHILTLSWNRTSVLSIIPYIAAYSSGGGFGSVA